MKLENLFAAAGKSNAPILDKIDFAGGVPALVLVWFIIISFTIMLTALTCWRQSQNDKAIIPED